jgi:hypothetical protein
LVGAGADRTVVDGGTGTGLLRVLPKAAPVTVAGVTLTRGSHEEGGAIFTSKTEPAASITVRDSALEGNAATRLGGAIATIGTPLTVIDSTINNNTAEAGGGIYANGSAVTIRDSSLTSNVTSPFGGGGMYATGNAGGPIVVTDSTVADNIAGSVGGGISASTDRAVELRYTTVAYNYAALNGGGLLGNSKTHLTLEGSILADDVPNECEEAEPAISSGVNIVFGASGCIFNIPGPLLSDPKLGSASLSGGPGLTVPLLRGSPALNAVGPACAATDLGGGQRDERGVARPQGSGCDLGSFESAADAALSLSASPAPARIGEALTVTALAADAGSDPLTGVAVTLPVPVGAALLGASAGCTAAVSGAITVSCQLGSLAPGEAMSASITIRPGGAGTLLDTASVTAEQADFNPANDTASLTSTVLGAAPPGPSSGPSGSTPTASADSKLAGRVLSIDRRGNVVVRIACSANAAAGCKDAVAVYSSQGRLPARATAVGSRAPIKAVLLARGHVQLGPGRIVTARLRLDATGRRLARRHRRLAARLLLTLLAPVPATTHVYAVTLKRQR